MSLELLRPLLPSASQMVGRDLVADLNLFYRARAAVGECLNDQGKAFFIENWPKNVDFMESPEGKEAITAYLNAWAAYLAPKPIAKEPQSAAVSTLGSDGTQ